MKHLFCIKAVSGMVLFVLLAFYSSARAATLTVTSTADSGPGTLRNAINTAAPGDTIDFNLAYFATITLSSQLVVSCSNLTITGPGADKLTISGNNSSRVFYVNSGVTVTIQDITVANGYEANGGGIGIDSLGTATLKNITLSGNNASNMGGGIYNYGGTVHVIDSTISNNTGVYYGAIENDRGTMTISGSTIVGNIAQMYGGIDNFGTMQITNSTIADNVSTDWLEMGCGVSGICNSYYLLNGTLVITNSTIVGNTGNIGNNDACYCYGGGIIIRNSIVADSVTLSNCAISGGFAAGTTSNISTDNSCGTSGFTQKSAAELALGPLQDNGGPTQTIALLAGSAAIDAADNAYCPSVDQRGVTRPQGLCDIGAYEFLVPVDLMSSANPSVYGQDVTITATALENGSPAVGTVTFKDGNSEICSGVPLSSGVATCIFSSLTVGDHTINAEFIGSSGSSGSGSLIQTVNKADQTITVTQHAPASAVHNGSFNVSATATSGLAVAITTSGACSGSGTGTATITMTSGTGTCTIYFDQAGNGNFNPAPQVSESTTAQKADQTITVTQHAPASAVHNGSFNVSATATSGLAVAITTLGACSGSGTGTATITMTSGTGTCTVLFNQAGNGDYNPAPQVTESTTAQKADQTITVTQHAPASAPYNGSFNVSASSTSGLGVAITTSGACTGSGAGSATITITSGSGTCTIYFDQTGNGNYNPAPQVTESTTAQKADQTITVTQHALAGAPYNGSFNVSATATSALGVAITTSGVCSGSGTGTATITMTSGTGTCTVLFNQAGNGLYNPAQQVTESTTAQKIGQTITAVLHAPASADYNGTFNVSANATSGLAVAITTSGACSGSGTGSAIISMTCKNEPCVVHYNQPGDGNYYNASEIIETTAVRYILTVIPSGTGLGTVGETSEPPYPPNGINCSWNGAQSSGTCWVCYGGPIRLQEVAGACSFYDGWEFASTETTATVTEKFELYPLVRLSTGQGYPTITQAYDNSIGTIQIQAHAFTEEVLVLDRIVDVTFDIGWNCDYTERTGFAAVKSLNILYGSITFENGLFVVGP